MKKNKKKHNSSHSLNSKTSIDDHFTATERCSLDKRHFKWRSGDERNANEDRVIEVREDQKVKSRRERHLDGDWDILLIFDYVFLCSFSLKHFYRNEWKISIGAKNSWNLNKFQRKFTLHSSLHFGSFRLK